MTANLYHTIAHVGGFILSISMFFLIILGGFAMHVDGKIRKNNRALAPTDEELLAREERAYYDEN